MFKKSISSVVCLLTLGTCSLFEQGISEEISLSWGIPGQTLSESCHLKDRVVFSLLQEDVRNKVEESFFALGIPHKLRVEESTLPCQFSVFFDSKESEKIEEVEMLLASQDIHFLEDFDCVKGLWQEWAQKEQDLNLSPAYVELLDKSDKVFQGTFQKDLSVVQKSKKAKRSPFNSLAQRSEARSGFMLPKQRVENGKVFKNLETEAFLSLPMSDEDKNVIRHFIINLANRSVEELMGDREGLEALKNRLDSVHPLRVAAFIFSDSTTVEHARRIMNTDNKANLFIILMQIEMQTARENGSLEKYMPGFVDVIGLDANTVWTYIHGMDYRGLLKYLLRM